jgi:hypothetical protein
MAEFSKQWCEINDPEMPHGFDIMVEYNLLENGHYIPLICEGFGFIAIGHDDDGSCILAMPTDGAPYGTVTWEKYDDVIK